MSIGTAGRPGTRRDQLNEPLDVVVAPDGTIFVAEGHQGETMTSAQDIAAGREGGATARIIKFSPAGSYLKEWGQIGTLHGEFLTPHELELDSRGRLWVVDRGNARVEIFDQEGTYLESRYQFGKVSGLFIADDDMVYAVSGEAALNWLNGVRVAPIDEDRIVGFIPPFPADDRPTQGAGAGGEDVAVDGDGNVYISQGPHGLQWAGSSFAKFSVE
jgi:DNA-binding beta-propeller fold protein YncE